MVVIYNKRMEKVSNLINPFKNGWKNNEGTNCYAYALGLDLSNISSCGMLNPGSFSGHVLPNPYTLEELLSNIECDLYALELDFKDVDYDYKLKNGEWKIAIMNTSLFNFTSTCDYHFLREVRNGKWMHKRGFYTKPSRLDSRNKFIKNPVDSVFEIGNHFTTTKYDYIKTLCLTKK